MIQRKIARRETETVARLVGHAHTPAPTPDIGASATNRVSADAHIPAQTQTDPPACKSHKSKHHIEKIATINMHLHRKRSNAAINREPTDGILDPPGQCCSSSVCPFCTGPLLKQRYYLLQRLFQLNYNLYGPGEADDMLQHM